RPAENRAAASEQNGYGLLEQFLESGEELRASGAVDDAMVAGQHERQAVARHDLSGLVHHRLPRGAADGEDRGVGRIDDRGKPRDAEHAEVRDAKRTAGKLVWLQLA